MTVSSEMGNLIGKMRFRLDDVDTANQEFEDDFLAGHIQNNLDIRDWSLPLDRKFDEQLVILDSMIDIVKGLKLWADGESYSFKTDAISISRGLLSKHYKDTIDLYVEERNRIIEMDGGFAL